MATESAYKLCTLCPKGGELVLRSRFADHYLRAHLLSRMGATHMSSVLDRKG